MSGTLFDDSLMISKFRAKALLWVSFIKNSSLESEAAVVSRYLHSSFIWFNNSCGIFVSHLSDQISDKCKHPIRTDGIEASGLDENLELIVDRNTRLNYHARSTPQLIVERLSRKSKGAYKEIYQAIIDKF